MATKKKEVIVTPLNEKEIDFLAGVSTVQNLGQDVKLHGDANDQIKVGVVGRIYSLKGISGITIGFSIIQEVADGDYEGDIEKDTKAEFDSFVKDLTKAKGLPECWKDQLPILEAYRAANGLPTPVPVPEKKAAKPKTEKKATEPKAPAAKKTEKKPAAPKADKPKKEEITAKDLKVKDITITPKTSCVIFENANKVRWYLKGHTLEMTVCPKELADRFEGYSKERLETGRTGKIIGVIRKVANNKDLETILAHLVPVK
jgi:hypothetical protein